ncbi:transporter substrate-binding domain-containing protein [Pseudomonas sp. MUP55]|uniref:substrate-binding periplasmic protein n=1 Tax=Pseudomonas sp. MUP55 TaxID=3087234 RepID=UPI002A598401|nr:MULTISPECIES: transporter substrate-binding domain-containing protein [unclassified Pseudomonas]WPN92161.1 transporter substrate-binding domain-containing protein [Pseudomonas sp. MUP56]WPN97686.1 transporter substrate-binding domain-containing protein [Pseudomonas sp. MUP55]
MSVRCWLLIMLCAVSSVLQADEVPVPGKVLLASEEWSDYTNSDGSGLAWDVLRQVFEPAGVTLQIRIAPYTRSVGLAQRGEVDGWVGSYRDEAEQVLYPRWHFDSDPIYALGLATMPVPSLATLGDYRLAWVRGYKYEKYLPNVRRFNQVQRRSGILSMLQYGHADFYIEALTEARYVLSQAQDPSRFRLTHIAELPLYIGFADNERGRALMKVYDERMTALVKNGELKPIFERWKQPYPF